MSNADLRDLVLDKLAPLPVTARAMFGGFGLCLDGAFFGVVSDAVLYFRTDDVGRGDYLKRGMPALQPKYRPRGPKTVARHFQVPAEVLEDEDLLREWALRAAATSQPSAKRKPAAGRGTRGG